MTTVTGYLKQMSDAAADSIVTVETAIAPVVHAQSLQVPGKQSTKGNAVTGFWQFNLGFGSYWISVPGAKVLISVTEAHAGLTVSFDQLVVGTLPTPQAPVGGAQPNASASVLGLVRTDESVATPVVPTGLFWKDSIAGVRALSNLPNNKIAFMLRGGEAYHWDGASLDADDGNWVLKTNDTAGGAAGRYRKRVSPGLGMVNVRDYGAKGDGVTDDTAAFLAAAAACPIGAQLWVPPGTYILDALILNVNVGIRGPVTAVLKHKANATSNMISYITPCSSVVEGVTLDGNKANQVLTGANHTRYACLQTYSDGMVVRDLVVKNYTLAGINDFNTETQIDIENVWFIDGAEHGGEYRATGRGTEQSSAIQVFVSEPNTNPHFLVRDCRVYNAANPSATGKAPGGFIFGGVLATNTKVTPIIENCFFYRCGQTYPRVGDANHIGCVDFYEACVNGVIRNCRGLENKYAFIKCQNAFGVSITENYANGMDAGILVSEGVALILVDVNRVLGDAAVDYGHDIISHNRLFDGGNVACIKVSGRGTASADEMHSVTLAANRCKNISGRALLLQNIGAGRISVEGGDYQGAGPTGSSGAVEVQNLDAAGKVIFKGVSIHSTANHGLWANSGIAGGIYIGGDSHITTVAAGTTAVLLAGAAARFSLRNCHLEGVTNAYNIGSAGTLDFDHYTVTVVAGGRSVTWASIGNNTGNLVGTGTPEGNVKASPGVSYLNLSGGAGTTRYEKESGAVTNTGWIGK